MILVLGFVGCMALVTAAVGQRGGFAWIGGNGVLRFLLVSGGFLLTMWGFYRLSEPGAGLPKVLSLFCFSALTLLLLVWAAVHLNDGLRSLLPTGAPKMLTILVFALSLVPMATAFGRNLGLRVLMLANRGELDDFQKGIVAQIDTTDVQNRMAELLVHTPEGRHPVIREKALAKIKSLPDWQERMVELLKAEWSTDVLEFLADNEVDNKALFPAAINEGILRLAQGVRRYIRDCSHPSHLYSGMRSTETRKVLEVARLYKDMGVDYRPAVQELRNAFDEPSPYDKPEFSAVKLLDKWLAR
jgi:hypothetical protein